MAGRLGRTIASGGRWLRRIRSHPVSFLGVVSVLCVLFGLVQFGLALALLAPADFAVIGVLMAAGGFIANMVDMRTIDLTTRLFFAVPETDKSGRADILAAGAFVQLALGLVVSLLTVPAIMVLGPRLLETGVDTWWILSTASAGGTNFLVSALTTYIRVIGDFRAFGWLRLGTQLATTAIMIVSLLLMPSVDGYFLAIGLSAVVTLGVTAPVYCLIARRTLGGSVLRRMPWAGLENHARSKRFLVSGSLIGFAKMLSRTGDVLVFAALSSDAVTGTYRVARQASDALFSLSDSIHQFYGPTIVAALSREDVRAFRVLCTRLIFLGLAAGAGAALAAFLFLDPLVATLLPQHHGAVVPFAVLSGLLVVTVGVHGWLWPALVVEGAIGRFSVAALAGGLAQLATMGVLYPLGRLDATTAALAVWVWATVLYGPFVVERIVRRLGHLRRLR